MCRMTISGTSIWSMGPLPNTPPSAEAISESLSLSFGNGFSGVLAMGWCSFSGSTGACAGACAAGGGAGGTGFFMNSK